VLRRHKKRHKMPLQKRHNFIPRWYEIGCERGFAYRSYQIVDNPTA